MFNLFKKKTAPKAAAPAETEHILIQSQPPEAPQDAEMHGIMPAIPHAGGGPAAGRHFPRTRNLLNEDAEARPIDKLFIGLPFKKKKKEGE